MPRSNLLDKVAQDLSDQLQQSNQELVFLVDRDMLHAHRHELIPNRTEEG